MRNTGVMASSVYLAAAGCTDVLQEPFDNLTNWPNVQSSTTPTIVGGRSGNAMRIAGINPVFYRLPVINERDTITIGFAFKTDTISSGCDILYLYSNTVASPAGSGNGQVRLGTPNSGNGLLTLYRTDGTVLATATTAITVNTWYYIELQVKLDDTAGTAKLRLNGILQFDVTGLDTKQYTASTFDQVRLTSQFGCVYLYDDLYITTGATCWFKGDQKVGSCNLVLSEPFNNTTNWATSGTMSITGGRTGTGLKMGNFSGNAVFTIPSASESDTLTIGCAVKVGGLGSEAIFMQLCSDGGSTLHGELRWNSAGSFIYVSHSSGLCTVSAGFAVNTWVYIEVQVRLHDTQGTLKVRVNETVMFDATGLDTRDGGIKNKFDTVKLNCTWYDVVYDDLYISAGDGCQFKGDQEIVSNCTSVMTESFDDFTTNGWVQCASPLSIGTGRSGTGATGTGVSVTRCARYPIPPANQSDYITVGFALKVDNTTGTRFVISLESDGGSITQTYLETPTDRSLAVRLGGSAGATLLTTPADTLPINVYNYIELKSYMHDTLGWVSVRVNGGITYTANNVDTKNTGTIIAKYDRVKIGGGGSGINNTYDDMYVTTGQGCGFGGDPQICNPVMEDSFNNFTDAPWVMGTINVTQDPTIVAGGRNGSGAQTAGDSYLYYRIPTAYYNSTITVGFAWKVSNLQNNILTGWESKGLSGDNVLHVYLGTTSSGAFEFYRYSGTGLGSLIGSSPDGTYAPNTWYYIEIQARLGTSGFVKLRVNGTLVINQTNIDTTNMTLSRANDKFVAIGIGSNGARIQTIDDFYMSSGALCAWQGDHVPYVYFERFNNLSAWPGGSPTIVAGRTGTAAQVVNFAGGATFSIPVANQSNYIKIGFAVKVASNSGSQTILQLYNGGLTAQVAISTAGAVFGTNAASSSIGGSPNGAYTFGTWAYVEIAYFLADGTAGKFDLRLNGVLVASITGFDSRSGTGSLYDQVKLPTPNGSSGGTVQWDDMYISTGPGAPWRGPLSLT